MAKWSRGMIPALGAGGPGFKSRFGPLKFLLCVAGRAVGWEKNIRGHSELNQGPAGLQPDALPLSYIPCVTLSMGYACHNAAGKWECTLMRKKCFVRNGI